MKYLIANWKAHKNYSEATEWIKSFTEQINANEEVKNNLLHDKVSVILCPSFPYISQLTEYVKPFKNIFIGSQDISEFEEGSHTGEVAASMIKDLVNYAVVGHSERRKELNESETMIANKVDQLEKNGIKPILCVRNELDIIYKGASLIAYEPMEAIGSGNNMSPTDVFAVKSTLRLSSDQAFIYGGSVNESNCVEYLNTNEVDGFLVGTAALDATSFFSLLTKFS